MDPLYARELVDKRAEAFYEFFKPWLTSTSPGKDGEWRGYCPVHEEVGESKTPSGSFNFIKGQFKCFKHGEGMSLPSLKLIVQNDLREESSPSRSRPASNVRSIDAARSKGSRLPNEDRVAGWVEALMNDPEQLRFITADRGIAKEVLEEHEVGWNAALKRFTLPVRDSSGVLVNVRLYRPNATTDKMKNITGHGAQTLYGVDALEHEEVVLTEGETDMLVGRSHDFHTITHTSGASSWNAKWSPVFEGKIVFVCYDNDDRGRQGAQKSANSIKKFAKEVYIVRLPLPNKGDDLTDYFVNQGYTTQDFADLLEETRVSSASRVRKLRDHAEQAPIEVSLEHSMSSEFTDVPITMKATIAGKVQPAYLMPKKVHFQCEPGSWGEKCNLCPMNSWNGSHDSHIDSKDPLILDTIDKNREQRNKAIRSEVGIPPNCPKVEMVEEQQWNVEELVLIPSVDDRTEEAQTPIMRKAYNVGAYATPINTTAQLTGFNTTDPRSGRGVLQAWEIEQTQTNLDKFDMTPEIRAELEQFRPLPGQSPMNKMHEIANDLEANVTMIYGRPEMHIAYDIVWHSAMDFYFRGTALGKGWLEMLVMGDTRTGKSEAALKLADHYQAGILKSCEGATFAGLVGGAQQVGNSWLITWGTIPLQDRRLVVLDEVSGMSDKNIIEQMSAVRSSGRAQVTKIVSQETSARTRLIWISNPPDGRTISEMSRGAIDAVEKLVKNPEDIARFDLAMSAASSDVSSAVINATKPKVVPHIYTSEMCSTLVSWVWSRKVNDVWWDDGVEDYIMRKAEKLGKHYIAEPPLIQIENVRVKLARVSVAIAARLFSTDDSGEKIFVYKAHVKAAVDFLNMLYGMPSFGYQEFSRKTLRAREEAHRFKKECRNWLLSNDSVLDVLKFVVNDTHFRVRDFDDFGHMGKDASGEAISNLMRLRMVQRQSKGYIKMMPELISIVKKLEAEEED